MTIECGKTIGESRGEMRRAIENVEVACAARCSCRAYNSEDIAPGIDEILIRQPLGVCAIIAPFNFPGMIPFWFLPYAIVAGNTVVLKPSERVPLTMAHVFGILEGLGLPPGVVNLVNGGREAVDTLLETIDVRAVSFVGIEPRASLLSRRRRRQTRAVPGRREESYRHCRRRRTWNPPRRLSRIRPLVAPASAVWPRRWPLLLAAPARRSGRAFATPRPPA